MGKTRLPLLAESALEPYRILVDSKRLALIVDQADLHAQMRRNRFEVPGVLGDPQPDVGLKLLGNDPSQWAVDRRGSGREIRRKPGGEACSRVRDRDDCGADRFGQAAQQGRDPGLEQARDEPIEPFGRDLIDQRQRHDQCQTVGRLTRLETVFQRQGGGADLQPIGEALGSDLMCRMPHEIRRTQMQDLRIRSGRLAQPLLELRR
jgi:hypothetical protein